jgi:hypothetical protein
VLADDLSKSVEFNATSDERDAEVRDDDGAWWRWWATDAERTDDAGVQSTNIIPGNKTSCSVYPLSTYDLAEVRSGEGQIQVQP